MKQLFVFILTIFSYVSVIAQGSATPEMADIFRSSGKIYVVVATISIIFIGLAIYLFSIDRRLKKIEKEK
jgi:CcmD family protein